VIFSTLSLEAFYEAVYQCTQLELLNDDFSNEKVVIERFGDASFRACLNADKFFLRAFRVTKSNLEWSIEKNTLQNKVNCNI
jgi:hypothetical protein